ncbi:MAG: CopD family protein [Methylobacteriaceae bacterium]|nr:CopD family protein [Methylobacteriaceae bacterium]
MEWVKTLHLFGVIGWMAGVFYMPRLLVNIAEAHKAGEPVERLLGMAKRLFRFCAGLGIIGMAAGIWDWLGYGISGRWLHWKLLFVVALIVYYALSAVWLAQMRRGDFRHSSIFFRVYNEFSLLMFVPILIFAVTKLG